MGTDHDAGLRTGRSGFDSRRGLGIFLFTTASRTALGPTQPGLFSWGQSGRGVKLTTYFHLVPRSENVWSYTSAPPTRLHSVELADRIYFNI